MKWVFIDLFPFDMHEERGESSLSVDCSPQYESGRTPSPQGTWPSVLLISTNKRRSFYCVTVFHWPTLGGWCINDIFLNEVGEANILLRWHLLFILTSFSTCIQIKKYELIFQSSIMTYTDKLNVIIWVLMYWRYTHLQYVWICLTLPGNLVQFDIVFKNKLFFCWKI